MEFQNLGKTGISVSRSCLGAMMFGAMGNRDHDDCISMIHKALDAGVNFIDTADAYSGGESEEIVGAALKDRRDRVVLATKFFIPMGQDPNMKGGSRKWIIEEVENSLRRLGTDYIDLYQIHRWDDATDIEETLSALTDLVRQGKVRAIGSSMFPGDRIVESQWTAEKMGFQRFRCEQPWYSIFARDIERTVLPVCERYGMGVIVWSPLDGGWLTGRYRSPSDLGDKTRLAKSAARFGRKFDPESELHHRKFQLVEDLSKIAADAGLSLAHLALGFAREHPAVTSVIIGPRTHEQLDDCLAASEIVLSKDTLEAIDALVPPGTSVNGIDPSAQAVLGRRARRRLHSAR
jgi:aryl-alcohol dehydrogenase-like predicted oxidoreductase